MPLYYRYIYWYITDISLYTDKPMLTQLESLYIYGHFSLSFWCHINAVPMSSKVVSYYTKVGCVCMLSFLWDNFCFYFYYRSAKAAMCLLPNSAVGIGAIQFARLESLNVGITFDTINQPSSPDDTFTMAWVMGMMLISSVMFMILTW